MIPHKRVHYGEAAHTFPLSIWHWTVLETGVNGPSIYPGMASLTCFAQGGRDRTKELGR